MKYTPLAETNAVDTEKGRSIIISGPPDCDLDKPQSVRQKHLEDQVAAILDILHVDSLPEVTYRMGEVSDKRPRPIKVVLPSRTRWITALANARLLRNTDYANVYVRKSMAASERAGDYKLRQEARERNQGKPSREWLV
ncbi:hypothetical protein OESDEN_06523 [Oesophagostomum dentatum]|uniref:Uncharacterized protein n=1 Tax=Oesophagostomum dentatum TaxID=61180 RepID=A0A0B1T8J5_OESDE|nr:hypothetical protein OESDEN_06523 [Oesophagostomum dentatum]